MADSLKILLLICLTAAVLVNAQERSCLNTGDAPAGQIFSTLTPQAGSVCQLDRTCCSSAAETTFKSVLVTDYESRITSHLTSGPYTCREHPIFNNMSSYISQSKNQLSGDIGRVYRSYARRFTNLFDKFFDYLANSVHTGNATQLPSEFNQMYFEVYLATFLSNPNSPRDLPTSEEFQRCFYGLFLELNGGQIQDWLRGFERSWNRTMRYFRALKAMDNVLEGIMSQQTLGAQCQLSLMRMTQCARCAGYPDSTQSCQGLCLNTLRGCLVDLGDLVEPIQTFSQALVAMKDKVSTFNPFGQITLLQANVFNLITTGTVDFTTLYSQLSRCGYVSSFGRRKRQASEGGGMTRSPRATITVPSDALNDSAHCLLENVGAFSHLPDTLCTGEGDDNCWNGRQLGSYSRSVVGFGRRLQGDNPEVFVCPEFVPKFSREIGVLRYMTRELNALTGTCSPDDEDCLVVPPTSLYYNLDAINTELSYPTTQAPDDDAYVSGSGSQEGGCQPPVETTSAPTTAAPTTTEAEATTSPPTTTEDSTVASTTTEAATVASTTTEAATVAPSTTTPAPTGPGGDITGTIGTQPVDNTGPGGDITGPGGDITGTTAVDTGGQDPTVAIAGSPDNIVNAGRGLLPLSLAVCACLALTAVVLTTDFSSSH